MKKYIFGPVPSRRLGVSLGVDLVPHKTCTIDCVYCECGQTTHKTIKRKIFVKTEDVISQLKEYLDQELDYITMSGSGEPTLALNIGEVIEEIKKLTDMPVCVLTNGTLLFMKEVRAALLKADRVMPSIDAVSAEVFQKINRPDKGLNIEKIISGIEEFSIEYKGQLDIEVLLVKGYNDKEYEIKKIADTVNRIKPNSVQLNTCSRPGTLKDINSLTIEELKQISEYFKVPVEIPDANIFKRRIGWKTIYELEEMLLKRPCTLEDIRNATGIPKAKAIEIIKNYQGKYIIKKDIIKKKEYYKIKRLDTDYTD